MFKNLPEPHEVQFVAVVWQVAQEASQTKDVDDLQVEVAKSKV